MSPLNLTRNIYLRFLMNEILQFSKKCKLDVQILANLMKGFT